MNDREKIVNAIEICYSKGHNCTECPFFHKDECNDELMRDVLELLKEQKPRWMTGDELTPFDVLETISSSYGGKQIFFLQDNGMIYDRNECDYVTLKTAVKRMARLVNPDAD